ncbi:uncharacterized protein AMSG_05088 [Thecamonas trahens ATCC 50062]|uniref:Uncharacterized protein n=1 Tax=Thecamonas trahens ATCC 50062 TaxID=461836 RepID=A0A0L0DCT2_THETB|nr:hypothetical protein AMSG_05088 [Thecamonas trahens ATCC 50062]KNC49118.1 hypothetical protein AMSG_05088 [Thecamonas trahens ATCC 50062]|eukprot:XP_013758146.1 hypothetical protein AMSG_05088 [Thecamonas trahens ATCC 50062]
MKAVSKAGRAAKLVCRACGATKFALQDGGLMVCSRCSTVSSDYVAQETENSGDVWLGSSQLRKNMRSRLREERRMLRQKSKPGKKKRGRQNLPYMSLGQFLALQSKALKAVLAAASRNLGLPSESVAWCRETYFAVIEGQRKRGHLLIDKTRSASQASLPFAIGVLGKEVAAKLGLRWRVHRRSPLFRMTKEDMAADSFALADEPVETIDLAVGILETLGNRSGSLVYVLVGLAFAHAGLPVSVLDIVRWQARGLLGWNEYDRIVRGWAHRGPFANILRSTLMFRRFYRVTTELVFRLVPRDWLDPPSYLYIVRYARALELPPAMAHLALRIHGQMTLIARPQAESVPGTNEAVALAIAIALVRRYAFSYDQQQPHNAELTAVLQGIFEFDFPSWFEALAHKEMTRLRPDLALPRDDEYTYGMAADGKPVSYDTALGLAVHGIETLALRCELPEQGSHNASRGIRTSLGLSADVMKELASADPLVGSQPAEMEAMSYSETMSELLPNFDVSLDELELEQPLGRGAGTCELSDAAYDQAIDTVLSNLIKNAAWAEADGQNDQPQEALWVMHAIADHVGLEAEAFINSVDNWTNAVVFGGWDLPAIATGEGIFSYWTKRGNAPEHMAVTHRPWSEAPPEVPT